MDSKHLAEGAIPLREVVVFCCPWVLEEISSEILLKSSVRRRKEAGGKQRDQNLIQKPSQEVQKIGRPDFCEVGCYFLHARAARDRATSRRVFLVSSNH